MAGIKDLKFTDTRSTSIENLAEDVNKMQDRLTEFVQPLVLNPTLDGLLLESVSVGTVATKIEHKLRRPLRGYVIVRQNAQAQIWESSQALPGAFLTLQASSPCIISLWVF